VEGDIGWFWRNCLVPGSRGADPGRAERADRPESRLDLDHYLEVLIRKPGALPGATALEQARAAGKFTPVHDAWWAAACKAHGDAAGTRALIEVVLLARHMHADHIAAGLAAALRAGALTADAVALEARKAAEDDHSHSPRPAQEAAPPATVTSLTSGGWVSCAPIPDRCRR
jgi:hypothetical protein